MWKRLEGSVMSLAKTVDTLHGADKYHLSFWWRNSVLSETIKFCILNSAMLIQKSYPPWADLWVHLIMGLVGGRHITLKWFSYLGSGKVFKHLDISPFQTKHCSNQDWMIPESAYCFHWGNNITLNRASLNTAHQVFWSKKYFVKI